MLLKISLITTCLNEERSIKEFLDSVVKQSKKPNEFIIVDGGSKDKTIEIIKKYSRKYKWIKLFVVPGASIGEGRNYAIERAKNEIIACTDAGCILDKDWLREITKPFYEDENTDVVVGIYKPYYTNDFEYFQGLLVIKEPKRIFGNPSRMSIRSMAFKKNVWEKVGKLPEAYGGDDTLFNLKLMQHKFKFKYSESAVVFWKMRKSLKTFLKQFYRYALGDINYGNLWRIRKNLVYFIFVNLLLMSLVLCSMINFPMFMITLSIFLIILVFLGILYLIKTKKISALFYVPLLYIGMRAGYFCGLWMGIFKNAKVKLSKWGVNI